ncbi:ATP11 protein-domain-containing protein [Scheffersomyces coipomensis]|uniref:ATP11 protein-domain-containing protein n=1 Tax=Scheffersomyces coipomensis TaxID=1788519 RepID=UPI00315D028F
MIRLGLTNRSIAVAVASRRSLVNVFRRCYSSPTDLAEKYKAKLEQRAKELGLNDVDELKTKLKDDIAKAKKAFNAVDPLTELEEYEKKLAAERKDSKVIKVRSPIDAKAPQSPYKRLESYVDVDKIRDLPAKEVELIWKARFQNIERSLHAVLTDLQFSEIYANAFKHPSFILPLPKEGEGYEMHFVQWSFIGPSTTHCMLTTVAEYKLHKEYAKPHTTLMFHQELTDKGIVLMNGSCEVESSLSMDEAQLLVLNVQRFYGAQMLKGSPEKKLALLKSFTVGDESFNIDDLVKEATTFE